MNRKPDPSGSSTSVTYPQERALSRNPNSAFSLESFLPYRINRLAEQMSQSLATVYTRQFRISIAQWRILATLNESPGVTAKDVAGSANLDKVRVSRAVVDLEDRGLLARRASQADGRASELRLTRAGRRLFERIAPLVLDWEAEFLGSLSQDQKHSLGQLLQHLEADLGMFTPPTEDGH